MRIVCIFSAVVLSALIATGCGDEAANDADTASRQVVAAFYPLAWAAEALVEDGVEVVNLTPPGVEPHDMELSPRDIATIEDAELVIYVGGGFQPALEAAIENAGVRAIDVLDVDGIDLLEAVDGGEGHEDDGDDDHAGEDDRDPHVWLDPARFAAIVAALADELDADGSDLQQQLEDLDERFAEGLQQCERREIFTAHTAFTYLAERYDLRQVAITGVSPEAEPRPRDLERVAREAREAGATTIFFERLVSPRLSEQVAREVGAETAVLDPLEGLDQDRADEGVGYIEVMQENLESLRSGLGCS
jgi:zinc transport system substrate-binding protein